MALINKRVSINNLISENINDAYRVIELVAGNLTAINDVAAALEAGELNPNYYTQAYIDATFAPLASVYTQTYLDNNFARIDNFATQGINDDASQIILHLDPNDNFRLGPGNIRGWDSSITVVEIDDNSAIYAEPDGYLTLANNYIFPSPTVGQKLRHGASSRYRQEDGAHYFNISNPNPIISITSIIHQQTYIIVSVGDSDWTAVGVSNPSVGLKFVANVIGSPAGTGTASSADISWEDNPLVIQNDGVVVIPNLRYAENAVLPFTATNVEGALNEIFPILVDDGNAYNNIAGSQRIAIRNDNGLQGPTVETALVGIVDTLSSQAQGKGASTVGIQDLNNNFPVTVDNVEEALNSIFTQFSAVTGGGLIGLEGQEFYNMTVQQALDSILHKVFAHGYHKITTSATIVEAHQGHIIHVEGGSNIIVTLPDFLTIDNGFYFLLDIKHTTGKVTLKTWNPVDQIDESPDDKILKPGDFLFCQYNGTEWETSAVQNSYGSHKKVAGIVNSQSTPGALDLIGEGSVFRVLYSNQTINYIEGWGTDGETNLTFIFGGSNNTLTHSSALSLPGGQDIVTQPGDVAVFQEIFPYNWQCIQYMPGTPPHISNAGHAIQTKLKVDGNLFTVGPLTPTTIYTMTTIPNKQDGAAWIEESITPTKEGNKIIIEAQISCTLFAQAASMVLALFEGNGSSAIAVGTRTEQYQHHMGVISLTKEITVGANLNPITFKLRVSATHENTVMYINGDQANGEHFSGLGAGSFIKITEIET